MCFALSFSYHCMSLEKHYYITTTLPYVNSEPHIGFAMEILRADLLARWQRSLGNEVFFNTGVDEHGLKIFRKAEELGVSAQEYCDQMAAKFGEMKDSLNLSYNSFIRTTDAHHVAAAQEFWHRCEQAGDIYKKTYNVKYCVGCELEKTESELVDGHCPLHPKMELELIDEENYFFRFSKYQQPLLDLYKSNTQFVLPEARLKEISAFVERGLDDFSISRLKDKMPWGVPVPGDDKQVMYVWFDALVNYISCLGWPAECNEPFDSAQGDNSSNYCRFWPGLQICGKDNLRQQSAMWQAMLMSANLPTSRQVLVNGFITSGGEKMSKSLGNVFNPLDLVKEYGTDAVRYYLLAYTNPFEDSDFTIEKFRAVFQADLANGLGNLASRVSTLLAKNNISLELKRETGAMGEKVAEKLSEYSYNEALRVLWAAFSEADEKLSAARPWKMTEAKEIKECLEPLAQMLLSAGLILENFLPETGARLVSIFGVTQIAKAEALFPRLD